MPLEEGLNPDFTIPMNLSDDPSDRLVDSLLREQARGRTDDALDAYNGALSLTPDDAYVLYNRGRAYQALGNVDEAKADFTAAAAKTSQPGARKLAAAALAELK